MKASRLDMRISTLFAGHCKQVSVSSLINDVHIKNVKGKITYKKSETNQKMNILNRIKHPFQLRTRHLTVVILIHVKMKENAA